MTWTQPAMTGTSGKIVTLEACPKCGSLSGWAGPSYVAARVFDDGSGCVEYTPERLAYVCHGCGFQRFERTHDAPPPPSPPPPDPSLNPAWTPPPGLLARLFAWLNARTAQAPYPPP